MLKNDVTLPKGLTRSTGQTSVDRSHVTSQVGSTEEHAPVETKTVESELPNAKKLSKVGAQVIEADKPVGQREGTSTSMKAHRLLIDAKKGTTPERRARDRLEHLKGMPTEGVSPVRNPEPWMLADLIEQRIGFDVASVLSPLELANALDEPRWAERIEALPKGLVDRAHGDAPHFVLACKLAEWMDNMWEGATLSDVAGSFKDAHPALAKRFPYLDESFAATLQRIYRFMPLWASKPAGAVSGEPAADWLDADASAAPSKKLKEALKQLGEVPASMTVTSRVAASLERTKPFKDRNVVMVQHMLGQAVPFVDGMVRGGMDPKDAEYVGVPYQKGDAVRHAVERTFGVKMTVPTRGDIDAMYANVGAAIDRAVARHEKNGKPILIVDDGGFASKWICEKYKDRQHLFEVVEQTTRGLTEISKLDPEFGITNVGGCHGKRFESNNVGDAVCHAIRNVLDAMTTTPARKDVLIVGAGKVGAAVGESFKGDGANVTVFDPFVSKKRKRELEKMGFTVITDKAEALDKKFLVVGCSGHRSIDMADFYKVSSPVFLASASSKRVEIDVVGLGDLSRTDDGVLRRVLAAKVGEQETFHYWLKDGRVITAIADGLPVNFQKVNSIAPELIDHTMALMLTAAAQATQRHGKGLIELDHAAQWDLQAVMDGVRKLTSSTSSVLSADGAPVTEDDIVLPLFGRHYSATASGWLAVAKSPATPPEVVEALYSHFARFEPGGAIARECLGAHHDVTPALVDLVQERGVLAHIGMLLQHDGTPPESQDKLLWFCKSAADDLMLGHMDGAIAQRLVSVESRRGRSIVTRMPEFEKVDGEHSNLQFPLRQGDARYDELFELRARFLSQLDALAVTHPREKLDPVARLSAPRQLRFVRAYHVHLLRRPDCDPAKLRTLFENNLEAVRDLPEMKHQPGANREAVSRDVRVRYACHVLEAFAENPASDEEMKRIALECLEEIRDRYDARVGIESIDDWETGALGIDAPDYL